LDPAHDLTSLNPACSLGPAWVSGIWRDQWLYAVAPPLGSLLGLGLFRLFRKKNRRVLTGKLVHAPRYRSLFRPPPPSSR
jgi:aquaporin Z